MIRINRVNDKEYGICSHDRRKPKNFNLAIEADSEEEFARVYDLLVTQNLGHFLGCPWNVDGECGDTFSIDSLDWNESKASWEKSVRNAIKKEIRNGMCPFTEKQSM